MFGTKYFLLSVFAFLILSQGSYAAGSMCSGALTTTMESAAAQDQALQRLDLLLNAPFEAANEGMLSAPLYVKFTRADAQSMYQLARLSLQQTLSAADLKNTLQDPAKFKAVHRKALLLRHLFRVLSEQHTAPAPLEQLVKKMSKLDDALRDQMGSVAQSTAQEVASLLSSRPFATSLNSFRPATQESVSVYIQSVVQELEHSLVIRRPMSAEKIQQLRAKMREILSPLRLRQAQTPDPALALLIRRFAKLRDLMGELNPSTTPRSLRDAVTSEQQEQFIPQNLADAICETLAWFVF